MNNKEKKENVDVAKLRKGRRMFCIYKDRLHIAEPDLLCSHAEWFKKEGWDSDDLIEKIPRGAVKDNGDIYFYVGNDFRINDEIESVFFLYLEELIEKLNLNMKGEIFGGLINNGNSTIWPSRKNYGEISKYLK